MRIIPALDIINGQCVRLEQGDFQKKKTYQNSPLYQAQAFEAAGLKYLHLVDLDGAKAQSLVNAQVLEEICTKTNLEVDFGGGIKSEEALKTAFECGASQVTIGSLAVQQPSLVKEWIRRFGPKKVILGADCRKGKIATSGWLKNSELEVIDFIRSYTENGIESVICTDIAKDGMLQGPSLDLYREILATFELKLIASGGVSSLADLEVLQSIGCEGAIVGKALYEGRIKLKELEALC